MLRILNEVIQLLSIHYGERSYVCQRNPLCRIEWEFYHYEQQMRKSEILPLRVTGWAKKKTNEREMWIFSVPTKKYRFLWALVFIKNPIWQHWHCNLDQFWGKKLLFAPFEWAKKFLSKSPEVKFSAPLDHDVLWTFVNLFRG